MGVETLLLLKASTDKLQSAKYTGMLGQQQLSTESKKKKQQVRERKRSKKFERTEGKKKCEECRTQSRTAALCTSLICRGGVQLVGQTAET